MDAPGWPPFIALAGLEELFKLLHDVEVQGASAVLPGQSELVPPLVIDHWLILVLCHRHGGRLNMQLVEVLQHSAGQVSRLTHELAFMGLLEQGYREDRRKKPWTVTLKGALLLSAFARKLGVLSVVYRGLGNPDLMIPAISKGEPPSGNQE